MPSSFKNVLCILKSPAKKYEINLLVMSDNYKYQLEKFFHQ